KLTEKQLALVLYGTKEENPEFWSKLSQETFLDRIQAPILLFHGDQDSDVPKSWSDHLFSRLQSLGKSIEYVEYSGEGHEFGPEWNDFMRKTSEFFKKNL
ncbi:MAG: prolyl oligopeptidase family serine peptidase, partial [Patescibacteria group bacterium]